MALTRVTVSVVLLEALHAVQIEPASYSSISAPDFRPHIHPLMTSLVSRDYYTCKACRCESRQG